MITLTYMSYRFWDIRCEPRSIHLAPLRLRSMTFKMLHKENDRHTLSTLSNFSGNDENLNKSGKCEKLYFQAYPGKTAEERNLQRLFLEFICSWFVSWSIIAAIATKAGPTRVLIVYLSNLAYVWHKTLVVRTFSYMSFNR